MNDKLPKKEISNNDCNSNKQINEYQDLIIRLKDIKDSISKLEKQFLNR